MLLSKQGAAQWLLEGDIQGCFNQISHNWLEKHIPMDKKILSKWLKAGYIHQKNLFPTEAGTPQGGVISPILANMALDGLEQLLSDKFARVKSEARKNRVKLVRYADIVPFIGMTSLLLAHPMSCLSKRSSQRLKRFLRKGA